LVGLHLVIHKLSTLLPKFYRPTLNYRPGLQCSSANSVVIQKNYSIGTYILTVQSNQFCAVQKAECALRSPSCKTVQSKI